MELDEETWARVYPWLEKAQDVPAEDLQEWVAQIVAQQPDVGIPLRDVLSTTSLQDEDEFLMRPLEFPNEKTSRVGQQVGAYTIDSLLAEGGMGEVWLAHRSDGNFEGVYAVKLLHLDSMGTKSIDRFKQEGRVLARLTHPNIARIMDAGVTPDRQPFLVLEYIAGEHIDEYCAKRFLPTRDRVRLFLDVLAAVAHAHSSLIIHRDIKPSNVLVTVFGAVKLLDFGIAKLVDPGLSHDAQGQLTRVEDVALTPSYAAPEQILGEPLSTATDVYQLGVLLHVLLAGRLPLGKADKTRSEHVLTALGENSVRVSDAVTGAVRKELMGDLDAIIEKSLRKRPEERYPTAAALSADLQRYLEHEPVTARDGILAYRTRKFVRRYRGAVISVTAVLASLIAATVLSLTQTHKIRLERDRADQITDFMTQVFKVADPSESRGSTVTAREILDKSSRQIEAGVGLDAGVQSDLLQVMANTYTNLGLYARAHSLAQAALDSRRKLLGDEDPKTLESRSQMGRILLQEGHSAEAETSLRQTLEAELRTVGPKNPLTLRTQDTLIYCLSSKGRYADAEALSRQVLATEMQTLGPRNALTLRTTTRLAGALSSQNRHAEAEALYRKAIAVETQVLGADHPDTLSAQSSLALMYRHESRYSDAEAIYRDVLASRRRILGEEHPETADTMTTLAIVLVHDASRYKEAEQLYRTALAIELKQVGPESRFTTRAEEGLFNLLGDEERFEEASPYIQEVLRVRLKLLGPDHTDTLLTQRNYACLLQAQGHLKEAEQLFRETLARDLRVLGPDDRDTLGVKYLLADTLIEEKRPQEAEVLAREAFEAQLRVFGPQHQETLRGMNRLGRALAAQGRYDETNALYASLFEKIARQPKSDLAQPWYDYGVMAARAGHPDDAFDHFDHAVALGFNNAEALRNDSDLKDLRGDPRFAKLIDRLQAGAMKSGEPRVSSQ
jgi:eukaryotic-like serine/threonine-protein kinase